MKRTIHSRLLALLLVGVMVFGFFGNIPMRVTAAAPTTYTNIAEGQTKTVTISTAGSSVYFRFIPQYSGTYTFRSSDTTSDPYGYLLDSSGNQLAYDDDDGPGSRDFLISYNCTAGTTYYLRAKLYNSSNTGSYTVSITGTTPTIAAGQSKAVTISSGGSYVDYLFVPTVTGTYTFESSNYTGDPHGYLLNSSKTQLVSDDDGGTNYNFRFTYDCTAGTTYFLRAAMHSSTTTGSYTVTITQNAVANMLDTQVGTRTYQLFNSGATGSGNGATSTNTAVTTLTNGGRDIYARMNTANDSPISKLGLAFRVNAAVIEQATLQIAAYDVDEDDGERDFIYLVDETTGTETKLNGYLSGMNEQMNTTTIRIDPSLFTVGHVYRFKVEVTSSRSGPTWYVHVRSVSIALTTGQATQSDEILDHRFTADISASGLVSTSLYLKTNQTTTYELEYAATCNSHQYGSSLSQNITATSSGVTKTVSFQLESGAPEGNYQVDVILKDAQGNVKGTYTVTTSGPNNSTVNYDANGGSNNLPLDQNVYRSGDTVTVLFDYVPSKTGYVFLGWARSSTATTAEFTQTGTKTFTIGADDVTLYAVWQAEGAAPDADVWDGTIASGFGGGTGTSANPYLIYTAEQLAYLARSTNSGTNYSGKYFKLMNNLDLNDLEWTPIGNDDTKPFKGNFNGNYRTISNLHITGSKEYAGLFGYISNNTITCLGVVDGYINTYYNNNPVQSGLLCASATNTTVTYCFTTGEIRTTSSKLDASHCVKVGMLMGDANDSRLQNCYAIGSVYGQMTTAWNTYAGGLVGSGGIPDESYHTLSVFNCYFSGTIESDGYETSYAGGIAGIGSANVQNSFATGSIYVHDTYHLGTLGADSSWGTPSATNSYYSLTANKSFTKTLGTSTSANNFKSQSWITTNLGWDFTNVWTFRAGSDYPVLKGFTEAAPHVHDCTATTVPETCTTEGYTLYECACGYSYQAEFVPAHPHTPGTWIVDTPATCTTTGLKHTDCTECGTRIDSVYIPATGHNYQQVVTRMVTCEEPGIITYTCTLCGYSYPEYIYAEHNYEVSNFVEATCTTDGYTTYTCTRCGDSYNDPIPGGHNYVAEVTKIASPSEEGEITYTCSICGHSYIEIVPTRPNARVLLIQDRLPWSENNNVSLLNKMVTDGLLAGWDMTTTASFDPADLADYGVVLIANDQTTATYNQLNTLQNALVQFANAGGVVIYGACDNGWAGGNINHTLPQGTTKDNFYSRYNYIVDADHPIVTGVNTDNKALTNTLLYGNYCSHTAFFNLPADANVILQDGHGDPTLVEFPMGDGHIILSGLTWEFYYVRGAYNGISNTTYTKNVYDDLVYYALQLSDNCDHAYDIGTVVAPTCTTGGYTLHTCRLCGGTMKDNATEAIGHTRGEWIVTQAPTTTTAGLKVIKCTVCDAILEEEVLPIIDAPVVSVVAPTNPVVWGTTFEAYIVVSDCDPVKSAAFALDYDRDIFELLSVEWLKPATLQIVTPEIISAWSNLTDINGNLVKLTFRAKALTCGSQITLDAYVQDQGVVTLTVVGETVAVIECSHPDTTITGMDDTYHLNTCTICGYNSVSVHTFDDSTCDTDCNECGHIRTVPHVPGAAWEKDGTDHWHICSVCNEITDKSGHEYSGIVNNICDICGYQRIIPGDIDGDGDVDSDDTNAPQIVLGSKSVPKGGTFTITATIKNNPGFAFLEVTPVFSPELTLVSVQNGTLVSDFTQGKQFIWVSDQDVTADGTLITLTFSVDPTVELGTYQVAFLLRSCIDEDENAVTLYTVMGSVEVTDSLYGDVNGDGAIDGLDVIRLKKYLANYDYDTQTSTVQIFEGADANGDGAVDGFDVIRLKKYLANYDYETGESTVPLGPQ